MTALNESLIINFPGEGNESNIYSGNKYRLTLITDRLIRVQVNRDNQFLDKITQGIICRDFGEVQKEIKKYNNIIEIKTDKVTFYFDEKRLKLTQVKIGTNIISVNNNGNLKGTVRTLDRTNGKVKLRNGILSQKGVSVLDDSKSLVIGDNGEIRKRAVKGKDLYVFAYGHDYRTALADFFRLSGEVPLIPKYAFGNWWSRYKAYTQDEYIGLMERFEKENIPISVATVDMDWHWVKVNQKFGTKLHNKNPFLDEGWTGYSWNTDLFYDYKAFLKWLKDHNYFVTLNLHPADGIRFYEDQYEKMCQIMGIDKNSKQTIQFDLSDNRFINAYFDILHHPYEEEGVDFWWMDWQQGTKSTVDGLDPLWALNHYHYLDNQRNNKRGMLLSRYSGAGAHRYPVGFSGDTVSSWKALSFQPYFTANASNVGFGFWSHDIGGHYFGVHDDELYLRWCQFGVFSPINRLHSTNQELMGKEPWKYCAEVRTVVNDFLNLRHKLLPYIYTLNHLAHKNGLNMCEPMYYSYPEKEDAYKVPNQYAFGKDLIVAPIVTKKDKRINMAKTKVWVPEGRYTDIFTGRIYEGEDNIYMFRDLSSIPVLAREGTILPLSNNKGNDISNPVDMTLMVYRGNNEFTLYEDDGISLDYQKGKIAETKFEITEEEGKVTFKINAVVGDESVTVPNRTYRIKFMDIANGSGYFIKGEEKESVQITEAQEFVINLFSNESAEIVLEEVVVKENPDEKECVIDILTRYQAKNLWKIFLYSTVWKARNRNEDIFKAIKKSNFPKIVKLAIKEVETKK